MKRHLSLALLVILLFLPACMKPYFQSCRDDAKNPEKHWKYSERQAGIGCDHAMLMEAAKFDKDKGIWVPNPEVVSVEDMKKFLKDKTSSVNDMLSYKNRELADMIDWFNMRPGLLKEEKVVRWLLRRINIVSTFNEFTDLVGEVTKDMLGPEAEYLMPNGRKIYSLRMISPSVHNKIPFIAAYLEAAKGNGTLVKVDSFTVSDSQAYAKKIENLYDSNEFTWDSQYRGWQIDSYKVMPDDGKPADNIVQYIEVFRIKDNSGKTETLPAVRGFLAAGGQNVSVFIVDYDKEGEEGFGDPDAVKRIFASITTGRDLFTRFDRDILYSLYDNPNNLKSPERRKPPERPVYLSIVPMGTKIDLAVWEEGSWNVPFDYTILSKSISVVFAPPKTPTEVRLEEKEKLKKILAFIQEFSQDGKKVIMEIWIPKKEYAERNIVSAQTNDTFRIRRKGSEEKSGEVEFFAQYKKIINYSFGGKWFQIVDEKGNGVFNKKREIADPTAKNNDSGSNNNSYQW